MLGGIWNFIKRHRRKIIVVSAVIGGVVYLGRYARRKMQELQEAEANEYLMHARRQQHFDSNQRTCNMTVLSMVPTLREALMQALDTESLTAELKNKPENKLEIWEQLKIMSFTRTIVSVYSSCLLIVMLRVQLNIVGGYMYVDTLNNKDGMAVSSTVVTPEIQQKYLSSIEYLLNRGLSDLVTTVKSEVQKLLGEVSLKHQMSLLAIEDLVNSVRSRMEYQRHTGYYDSSTSSLYCYVLQEENESLDSEDLSTLDQLLKETRDMLESPDFHHVLTTCLDTGFKRLLDKVADYFKPSMDDSGKLVHPNEICMPLAKVVPIMNGLIHTVCSDAPNPFMQELLLKEQVKDFAANVYEAFSQTEQEQQTMS